MAAGANRENHLLLTFGTVLVLIAGVVIRKVRMRGSVNGSTLGWMSEQWLAEHRATHSESVW